MKDRQRPEYLGLSLAEAQKRAAAEGPPARHVSADGEEFLVTADDRPDGRINFETEDGVVVCALMY